MKPLLIIPTLLDGFWVELPNVIVVSAEWLARRGGLQNTRLANHPIIETEAGS